MWAAARIGDKKAIIVEKNLAPELDRELGITYAFNSIGFTNVPIIEGHYYPALVWEFYCNMRGKTQPEGFAF